MQGKSVRLDVYVEDEHNTIYNIEMQTTSQKHLPKRMRYYQGVIDLNIIKKGEQYKMLKKSYVIFVCTFDPYHQGRHIYTFENYCREDKNLSFGDETVKIVLNANGTMDDVSDDLKAVLRYIAGGVPQTAYTKLLDDAVTAVKSNREWRREYMTLLMRDQEKEELGKVKNIVDLVKINYTKRSLDELVEFFSDTDSEVIERIIELLEADVSKDEIVSTLLEEFDF